MASIQSDDAEWRAGLHGTLEAILDVRAELETELGITRETNFLALPYGLGSHAHLADSPAGLRARILLTKAVELVADAIGVPLRCAALQQPANDGAGKRAALRTWIETFEPVLKLPLPTLLGNRDDCLAEHEVWLALRALDVGEVRDIFNPANRGNRPANLYSLSIARLTALEWKRRLISLGYSEGNANREITAAFGEQWDTIRKWEASCASILSKEYVAASLRSADTDEKFRVGAIGRGLFGGYRENPSSRLERAGQQYRWEKQRAADLSPAKQRAARRAEKQSAQISG